MSSGTDFRHVCDLCGLNVRCIPAELPHSDKPLWFCCQGCKMVYMLLLEAADSPHPGSFRETALFRQCQAAGVIPRSEKDLEILPAAPPGDQGPTGPELELVLRISGMWCPACAWVIETAVCRVKGVHRAACTFSSDRFHCTFDPVKTSPALIVQAVEKMGYKTVQPGGAASLLERKRDWIRFGISAFLSLNVMMLSLALYGGFFTHLTPEDIQYIGWPICAMASVVMAYGGRPIFQKAWHGLIAGSPGMEALVGMGALSAYGYSVFHLWQGSFHTYFDTASMLITLVLLGKLIEGNVRKNIQADLDEFLNLMPKKVRRLAPGFPDGRYEAAERLTEGDVFILSEGEIAAADGLVIAGSGRIDTSSLTGEAVPVFVTTGDAVLSGSRMLSGRLSIKASAVGSNANLGQMIALMETAISKKIPLESKTDRILRWFVPGIILTAAAAGAVSFASGLSLEESLIRAITVMVISCPCAMGIAIPLARVAGISLAAGKGLLVRDFSALEMAGRITTVVFDKTGTLTTGSWSLLKVICTGDDDEDRILAYAAALECRSQHHIAVEIRGRALTRSVAIPDPETLTEGEQGIAGRVNGLDIRIGSPAWIGSQISVPASDAWEHGAVSRVFMSIAGQQAAIFVFGDRIRPTAGDALKALRQMGKKLAMISGDEPQAVKFVADRLGIPNYRGGLTPGEKAGFIGELCRSGEKTAMVGDGVNDAPAMAGADLAIAVHSGYPLGRETGGIILMQSDPAQMPELLELAGRVTRIITQNLWWALIYNLISIPVAISGLLNPLVAVTAMLLSSLSVVGNTLRLTKE